MKKNIELTVEQAKYLYSTHPEYRKTLLSVFSDEELGITPILRDWEEVIGSLTDSYYPTCSGNIEEDKTGIILNSHTNVPTIKHAKSMLAFAKLSILMNDLGDECDVDWIDYGKCKYTIVRRNNRIIKGETRSSYQFLAFKTESIRDAFLEKHEQLIKDYYMI